MILNFIIIIIIIIPLVHTFIYAYFVGSGFCRCCYIRVSVLICIGARARIRRLTTRHNNIDLSIYNFNPIYHLYSCIHLYAIWIYTCHSYNTDVYYVAFVIHICVITHRYIIFLTSDRYCLLSHVRHLCMCCDLWLLPWTCVAPYIYLTTSHLRSENHERD